MPQFAGPAHESSAVQTHLTIMQGVIQRMAENSRSCKVWCVTLVSATLVLVARIENPQHAFIALVPALLLLVLDTYYLAKERGYRSAYNEFVSKLHSGKLALSDTFVVEPSETTLKQDLESIFSISILPFYLTLAAMVVAIRFIIAP